MLSSWKMYVTASSCQNNNKGNVLFIYIVLDVWPKKESIRHVSYGLHIILNLESGFSRLYLSICMHFRFQHVTKYCP